MFNTDNLLLRSFMFLPAHNTKFIDKALAGDADAIILDMEDAVPASRKAEARQVIAEIIMFEVAAPRVATTVCRRGKRANSRSGANPSRRISSSFTLRMSVCANPFSTISTLQKSCRRFTSKKTSEDSYI